MHIHLQAAIPFRLKRSWRMGTSVHAKHIYCNKYHRLFLIFIFRLFIVNGNNDTIQLNNTLLYFLKYFSVIILCIHVCVFVHNYLFIYLRISKTCAPLYFLSMVIRSTAYIAHLTNKLQPLLENLKFIMSTLYLAD